MSRFIIRNSSKALLLRGGEILLNCCADDLGEPYYDLPGGGQDAFESIEEALHREIMEETGYIAKIDRFAAIAEEIYDDPQLRGQYPDYCHRVMHIFVAHIEDETVHGTPVNDFQTSGSRWFSLEKADMLPVLPVQLRGRIREILGKSAPVWLGTVHIS